MFEDEEMMEETLRANKSHWRSLGFANILIETFKKYGWVEEAPVNNRPLVLRKTCDWDPDVILRIKILHVGHETNIKGNRKSVVEVILKVFLPKLSKSIEKFMSITPPIYSGKYSFTEFVVSLADTEIRHLAYKLIFHYSDRNFTVMVAED